MIKNKSLINDTDFFVYSIIGVEQWEKISGIKKLRILKKYDEIQKIVNENNFSWLLFLLVVLKGVINLIPFFLTCLGEW